MRTIRQMLVLIAAAAVAWPAVAYAQPQKDSLYGKWVDHVHGEAEWVWSFKPDGTFVADHRQGFDRIEGTYSYHQGELSLKWFTPDRRRELAWGRVLSNDEEGLRFRFTQVKSRLAQAPIIHLVRPGEEAEQYTEKQVEEEPVKTRPLVRVETTDGNHYVGTIVEESRAWIVVETERAKHKIRRRKIRSIKPATAEHAE